MQGYTLKKLPVDLKGELLALEAAYVRKAMREAGNHRTLAAQLLGINRSCLLMKLRRFGWMKRNTWLLAPTPSNKK